MRDKEAAPREFYHHAAAALEIAHRTKQNDYQRPRRHCVGAESRWRPSWPVGPTRRSCPTVARRRCDHWILYARYQPSQAGGEIALGLHRVRAHLRNLDQGESRSRGGPDSLATRFAGAIGTLPLVAIGGINETNARSVLKAGADALAMISKLVSPPTRIAENMREMQKLVNS